MVEYINKQDIAFDKHWLDVFLDFRFPNYGQINVKGINSTLRAGIEPWIVLTAEITSAGTSRYVDSPVERLEIVIDDLTPDRDKVLCNFTQVPLVKQPIKTKTFLRFCFHLLSQFNISISLCVFSHIQHDQYEIPINLDPCLHRLES